MGYGDSGWHVNCPNNNWRLALDKEQDMFGQEA
jgi:hypothetical protein